SARAPRRGCGGGSGARRPGPAPASPAAPASPPPTPPPPPLVSLPCAAAPPFGRVIGSQQLGRLIQERDVADRPGATLMGRQHPRSLFLSKGRSGPTEGNFLLQQRG